MPIIRPAGCASVSFPALDVRLMTALQVLQVQVYALLVTTLDCPGPGSESQSGSICDGTFIVRQMFRTVYQVRTIYQVPHLAAGIHDHMDMDHARLYFPQPAPSLAHRRGRCGGGCCLLLPPKVVEIEAREEVGEVPLAVRLLAQLVEQTLQLVVELGGKLDDVEVVLALVHSLVHAPGEFAQSRAPLLP